MRRILTAAAVSLSLLVPGVAMAHAGDSNTQLHNAVSHCETHYGGCRLLNVTPSDIQHRRVFFFRRNNTSGNGQDCYTNIITNHYNVVSGVDFIGCY